jgi:hypothetical protein
LVIAGIANMANITEDTALLTTTLFEKLAKELDVGKLLLKNVLIFKQIFPGFSTKDHKYCLLFWRIFA